MSNRRKFFTLALLSLILLGYEGFEQRRLFAQGGGSPASAGDRAGNENLSPDGAKLLHGFLDAAQLPDLHWPDFSKYQKDVQTFYGPPRGDSLAWVRHGRPSEQARAIVLCLQQADVKGLNPEDYDSALWDDRIARLDRASAADEAALVRFDLALTISVMRYVSDVHVGRANPGLFHSGLDIDHQQAELASFLNEKLVNANNVEAVLSSVEPPFPIYSRTQDALKRYLAISRSGIVETLPAAAKAVKTGDSYDGTAALEKLLTLLGDLPPSAASPASPEGTYQSYQGPLVSAVKHFQSRHGLTPNGIIDAATLRELNTPLSQRVTQLQLAMERMRWLPHEFDRPPVIVNIPEFRLYAVNEKYLSVFIMNVVVGKAYGHQTPVFANEIRSVIFRPYWNVPQDIAIAEFIPHLKKSRDYLAANSYELVDRSGKVVADSELSDEELFAQLHSGAVRIRQTPGGKNALGLVKFEFPNVYDVYMHGTPATELFSRSRRDFSHGCIRLEDPPRMAEWVLRDMPEWTEEKIRSAMNGDETVEVRLKHPIPVLIFYSTAVVLEGQEIRFSDDIYGLDAELERHLGERYPETASAQLPVKK